MVKFLSDIDRASMVSRLQDRGISICGYIATALELAYTFVNGSNFVSIERTLENAMLQVLSNRLDESPFDLSQQDFKAIAYTLYEFYGWDDLKSKIKNTKATNCKELIIRLETVLWANYQNWVHLLPPTEANNFYTFAKQFVSDYCILDKSRAVHTCDLWRAVRQTSYCNTHDWGSVYPKYSFYLQVARILVKQHKWASGEKLIANSFIKAHRAWMVRRWGPAISDKFDNLLLRDNLNATTNKTTSVCDTTSNKAARNGTSKMMSPILSSYFNVTVVNTGNQLSDDNSYQYRTCGFCSKEVRSHHRTISMLSRLSGGYFYCGFCVDHNLHTRRSKHVLMLSYRAVIGYLYHFCYNVKSPKLYIADIQELIENHVSIGQLNPAFSYDPESFMWFIDFEKIGNTSKKIPINEVICTANEIVSAFNLYNYVKDFNSFKFTTKIIEAINDFYQKRYRPKDRRACVPTLLGCASDMKEVTSSYHTNYDTTSTYSTTSTKKIEIAAFRSFMPRELCPLTKR